MRRVGLPPGGSTLMTSAPNPASVSPQYSACSSASSMTRMPVSGPLMEPPQAPPNRRHYNPARQSLEEMLMPETSPADFHPPYLYPDYKSTRLRAPSQPLVRVAPSPLEATSPVFPKQFVRDSEADLTTWGASAPLGE